MAEPKRVYRGVPEWSRAEAAAALATGSVDAVCDALLSLSFYDADWRYAQDACLRYVDHPLAGPAATIALGHIGRVHGRIDPEQVVPVLMRIRESDSPAAGNADSALADLRQFVAAARPLIAELDRTADRLADALVGRDLFTVTFGRDHVQLDLLHPRASGHAELRIWNPLIVRLEADARDVTQGQPGWRDALCALIDREVATVDLRAGERVLFGFTSDATLTVSLRPDDYRSAEAVSLYSGGHWISL